MELVVEFRLLVSVIVWVVIGVVVIVFRVFSSVVVVMLVVILLLIVVVSWVLIWFGFGVLVIISMLIGR